MPTHKESLPPDPPDFTLVKAMLDILQKNGRIGVLTHAAATEALNAYGAYKKLVATNRMLRSSIGHFYDAERTIHEIMRRYEAAAKFLESQIGEDEILAELKELDKEEENATVR